MAILVDGYNLVFSDEELAEWMHLGQLERAREALVSRLVRFRMLSKENVTVIFDGAVGVGAPRDARCGVRILYSRAPRKADAEIEELLAGETCPEQLTVVSSDREVRETAERRKAKTMDCATFWRQMESALKRQRTPSRREPGEKYGKAISPEELNYWLKAFGGHESGA